MFCRVLFADLRRRHSGREGREPEIEARIGNARRGNVARPILLSVGSKWRLCVIDTVVFALKMSELVIYSVVGGFESYPGTSGLNSAPGTSSQTARWMYVSQPYCAATLSST